VIRRAAAYVIAGIALAWILAACASIPVVPAQPRGYAERERAAVRVDVACNVYGLPGFDDQPHYDDGTMIHIGSGVVFDERHVLTAAHVVACPTLPGVVLTTYDGRHLIAVVTREDVTADVAVLELATADRLHLDIAPPTRAPVLLGSTVCAEAADPQHETHCGAVEYVSDTTVRATFLALHGNSGAGVYDLAGRLVGLVTATAKSGDPIAWITPRLP
jgi:S1-C subfamily serine protease